MTMPVRDAILRWIDAHQADVIGLAQSLVRIPSENKPPHGSEKACQEFVAETLRKIGCRVEVFTPADVAGLTEHPAYRPGRDYTDRPNVVGVMSPQPAGPVGKAAGRRSLLLTGHIDVVPIVGQGKYPWWDGTIVDGRLCGRGANDMKRRHRGRGCATSAKSACMRWPATRWGATPTASPTRGP